MAISVTHNTVGPILTQSEYEGASSHTITGETQVTFCDSEAFNSTCPTSFTDLDLSSIVGSNAAFVMLRITNNAATASNYFYFRTNGDTGYGQGWGVTKASAGSGNETYLIVKTDSSGIVEWHGSDAKSTTLDVIMYVR